MGTLLQPMGVHTVEVDYEFYKTGRAVELYLRVASERSGYFDCQRVYVIEDLHIEPETFPFSNEEVTKLVLLVMRPTNQSPIEYPLSLELLRIIMDLSYAPNEVLEAVSGWMSQRLALEADGKAHEPSSDNAVAILKAFGQLLRELPTSAGRGNVRQFLLAAERRPAAHEQLLKLAELVPLDHAMWHMNGNALVYIDNPKVAPLLEALPLAYRSRFLRELSVARHNQKRFATLIHLEKSFCGTIAFVGDLTSAAIRDTAQRTLSISEAQKFSENYELIRTFVGKDYRLLRTIELTASELAILSSEFGAKLTIAVLQDWERLDEAPQGHGYEPLMNAASLQAVVASRAKGVELEPDWELQLLAAPFVEDNVAEPVIG